MAAAGVPCEESLGLDRGGQFAIKLLRVDADLCDGPGEAPIDGERRTCSTYLRCKTPRKNGPPLLLDCLGAIGCGSLEDCKIHGLGKESRVSFFLLLLLLCRITG